MLPKSSWLLTVGAVALGVIAVAGFRRGPNTSARVSSRVTVALVNSLPANGMRRHYDSMILRQLGRGSDADVILLTRNSASGAALDAAMRALTFARAAGGSRVAKYRGGVQGAQQIGVVTTEAPVDWTARFSRPMQRVVDSLLHAPARQVAGVGQVPAVDFFLPHKIKGLSGH
jgi:hypothetical protein